MLLIQKEFIDEYLSIIEAVLYLLLIACYQLVTL